jgi:hypothetical protein
MPTPDRDTSSAVGTCSARPAFTYISASIIASGPSKSATSHWAAFRSYVDQSADRRARRKDPNRIVELHAMIGAIGEQAGLCWGFEQDAQRFDATRNKISKEHHRLVLRALSEAGGHFLLGAAHSLGNLGLRIGLLDPEAAPAIQAARPKADFAPGSDDKRAWLSLSASNEILAQAAGGSANVALARISFAVSGLAADPRYVALDSRRGMDYHRLRPQSVPHASPRRGVSQAGDGIVTIDLPGSVLDPEADADRVYQLLVEAMEAVRQAMVTIRNDLAKAVRAAGLWCHEPTPGPTAARAKKAS